MAVSKYYSGNFLEILLRDRHYEPTLIMSNYLFPILFLSTLRNKQVVYCCLTLKISCRRSLLYKLVLFVRRTKVYSIISFDKMNATRVVVILSLIQSQDIIQIQRMHTSSYYLVMYARKKTDVHSLIPRTKMFKTIIIDTIIINHLRSILVSISIILYQIYECIHTKYYIKESSEQGQFLIIYKVLRQQKNDDKKVLKLHLNLPFHIMFLTILSLVRSEVCIECSNINISPACGHTSSPYTNKNYRLFCDDNM